MCKTLVAPRHSLQPQDVHGDVTALSCDSTSVELNASAAGSRWSAVGKQRVALTVRPHASLTQSLDRTPGYLQEQQAGLKPAPAALNSPVMKMNAMDVRKPSPKMWMPNMLLYIGCSNGAVNIIAGRCDPCLNSCTAEKLQMHKPYMQLGLLAASMSCWGGASVQSMCASGLLCCCRDAACMCPAEAQGLTEKKLSKN